MDSLSLKNLTNALSEVDGWKPLGVQLDINYHKLKEFGSLPTIEERKLAMLQFWLDTDIEASWQKLLCGLKNLGLNRVVQQIQKKYQVPPSNQADFSPVLSQPEDVATVAPSLLAQTSMERKREVQSEIDTLKCTYDRLFRKAVEFFKEKHAETPTFFSDLRTSIGILPSSLKDEHIHFLEEKSSKIAKATSVDELFIIVNCYGDFLNCSLVAHIIERFGDVKLKEDLQNYTAELEAFRSRTNLSDFVAAHAGCREIPPGFLKLVLKMGPQWELRTLKDLEEFRTTLKGESFLTSYAVRFMGGNTGSIFLVWSVPRSCNRFLIRSLESNFLLYCSIEEVIIDGKNLEEYRRNHYPFGVDSPKYYDEFSERLVWASGEGCLEDVVFLLSTGVEVNGRGERDERTALMSASRGGHLDVVRELLKAQADVNVQDADGWTTLMYATLNGHSDAIQLLISTGAQPDLQDKYGMTALMWASFDGHTEAIQLLISTGAKVDLQSKVGETALMYASTYGHSDAIQVLLSAGAQVDLQDEVGETALMYASTYGHSDAIQVLISAGARVDLQQEIGFTALMWASYCGHTDAARALVSAGARVDLQSENGLTALILAVQRGHTEAVDVLVKARADVNLQENTSGRSAIFYGAEKGYLEIVKILMHGGATLSLKDKDGATADEVAEVHGHQAICDELRKNVPVGHKPLSQDGVTADEVAEVHSHQAVSDELKKHTPVGRRPLSQAVRDRVLATSHLLRALYKKLEEKIFRTQKKELARRTQGLDPEIPPPQHSREEGGEGSPETQTTAR